MIIRKLRDCFVDPLWVDNPPQLGDDDRALLIPIVEDWCIETFGKAPIVHYDDRSDYDGPNYGWTIWFDTEAQAVAFRMRWYDFGR